MESNITYNFFSKVLFISRLFQNTIMKEFTVYMLASNHPDQINTYWGLFIKWSVESIQENGVNIKTFVPRPYSLPFSKFSRIPNEDLSGKYPIYYPRFLYLIPKKIFYGFSGESYKNSIDNYLSKNFTKPNIIHAHHIYLDGYASLKYCKNNRIPLVISARGTTINKMYLKKNLRKRIDDTLKYASRIICVSDTLRNKIINLGFEEEKVRTIPSGTKINRFDINNRRNKNENIINILFVGQLTEMKGAKTLLKVIKKIGKQKNKIINFTIVGDGPYRDRFLQLDSRHVNVLGNVLPDNINEIYVNSDIFILPSLSEGRPNVIYEAMASQCAIVASNVGGIHEQVKDGYNGFLVEANDIEGFIEKIQYLIDNNNLLKIFGVNGRKRIIDKRWTWENYGKEVTKIYNEIA